MPRTAREVVPGVPHHVIQRGNRKQSVFLQENDRLYYLRLLKKYGAHYGLKVWAYCLMDNHVHLVVVPSQPDSFMAFRDIHRRYTYMVNSREGWTGYLWQGRFKSDPMDAPHVFAGVRYVERNPVRAGLVKKAENFRWSSAKFHVHGWKSELLERFYLQDEIKNWSDYLSQPDKEDDLRLMRKGKKGTH